MTPEEIKEKRMQLEDEKEKQGEKLSHWNGLKSEAMAHAEEQVENRYRKVIDPINNRISAIEKELNELQSSCPKRDDKDEHGEETICSFCGEINTNLDD